MPFGMNEKGGMDNKEFEKYMINMIVPLYLNAKERPGKRAIIKVDSGLGRMNLNLITRLRFLGFILYPCISNTIHVMQDKMDQNYGPFKTQFPIKLEEIIDARINEKKSLSFSAKVCWPATVWRN